AVTVLIFSVSIYALNGSKVEAATVGQKLTAPEEGWQRYEESNSLIVYNGTWHTNTGSIYGGGSNKYGDNASVEFVFYGTQMRFIGGISTTEESSENIQIYVDGSLHGSFSQKGSSVVTALNYEIRNLPLGNHKIKVVTKERMIIDSIDINSDGKLIPVSEYQPAHSNI
ncbi:hypothetical protein, partial [Burkholderia thailandensis]|uniref:hypothetical protein n=1 Tax=Burkholderia thailandensis TaxID=57975 RepID=UPI00217DE026